MAAFGQKLAVTIGRIGPPPKLLRSELLCSNPLGEYSASGAAPGYDNPIPIRLIVRRITASRCNGDCADLHLPLPQILKYGTALHFFDPACREFANPPFAIGHEYVAEVVSLGEHVRNFSVGQGVIVPWSISCGHCRNCQRGLTSKCSNVNGDRAL